MPPLKSALLVFVAVTAAAAQSADPLLSETRLTVHTLLREDIFAGFRSDNMDRFAKGEQNIEILLKERPGERANLLAWKGLAATYRAVRAHESGQAQEFERRYAEALDGFSAAAKLEFGNGGVAAITGGTFALFADRLPEKHRAAAWSQAYDNYAMLWKQQGAGIEKLPLHHKGEVLAGLTQSAQRTGRSDEAALYLDKMLTLLPDTPYEAMAKQWKSDPASAATTNLTCKGCHGPGRLANRLEALKQQ
jgi:tetratricopeptide (TPR) repeat protein